MSHLHSEDRSGPEPPRPNVGGNTETELSLRRVMADRSIVIEAYGEIDIASAGELRAMINSASELGADHLIVDLSGIRFMDSSGLNALLGTARQLGPGSFGVAVSRPSVRNIFAMTGLDRLIPVFDSVAEAVHALELDRPAEDGLVPGSQSILDPS
jgi:anti-sigma B factor antagonist